MTVHCSDVEADRRAGEPYERGFCWWLTHVRGCRVVSAHPSVIAGLGADAKPLNQNSPIDVWFEDAGGKLCAAEVKGKSPTKYGCYGLEVYRADKIKELLKKVKVYYVIFNKERLFGIEAGTWLWADFEALLSTPHIQRGSVSTSWRDGIKRENEPMFYWPVRLWKPLPGTALNESKR